MTLQVGGTNVCEWCHSGSSNITPAITCGPRRARALPVTRRGAVGRSLFCKARDRPDRQVHCVVSWPLAHDTVRSCASLHEMIRRFRLPNAEKLSTSACQRAVTLARSRRVELEGLPH